MHIYTYTHYSLGSTLPLMTLLRQAQPINTSGEAWIRSTHPRVENCSSQLSKFPLISRNIYTMRE